MKESSKKLSVCQLCASPKLNSIVFIGYVPPVNAMQEIGDAASAAIQYPLELVRCDSCGLVQLNFQVCQSVLFPESYPYLSRSTKVLRDNFFEQAQAVDTFMRLGRNRFVVDIGSNDGSLLKNYLSKGCSVLGIEPSQAADIANSEKIPTWKSFFNFSTAAKIKQENGVADVVTACNVFAHIENVNDVIKNIKSILHDDGIFVSESHYLADLINHLQFDTIYHEHLRYYDVTVLSKLFERHNLEIFHVEKIPTHGGSIRCFTARKGKYKILPTVGEMLVNEASIGLTDGIALERFAARMASSKLAIFSNLKELGIPGKRMYGIGAPSRASTLISYLGIGVELMPAVVEIAGSHKLNKYIPGTRIPVIDESALYRDQPEYAFLLSWHIAEELSANIRSRGFKGRFIKPLPTVSLL